MNDARAFEHVVAHDAGGVLWSELNPDIKAAMFLPNIDVGIDYVVLRNGAPVLLGQAKYYVKTPYISAHDFGRVILCAYQRGVYVIE